MSVAGLFNYLSYPTFHSSKVGERVLKGLDEKWIYSKRHQKEELARSLDLHVNK